MTLSEALALRLRVFKEAAEILHETKNHGKFVKAMEIIAQYSVEELVKLDAAVPGGFELEYDE